MSEQLIVGIGGTLRQDSTTERAVARVLYHAQSWGARTRLFAGTSLVMPFYGEAGCTDHEAVRDFVAAVRQANAFVIGSPGYHGGISGLVKNALDYTEELASGGRVYLDGCKVVCIATGAGWQGANTTLAALRNVVFALRGWPTPLGFALNARDRLFAEDGSAIDPTCEAAFRTASEQLR